MAKATGLAMSWAEWARHDGMALADLVRKGEVAPRELAAQAAAGVARLDPKLEAILEIFDDAVANPHVDGPNTAGRLYGVPIFLKDLGSALKGRRQESGSRMFLGTVAKATDPTVANFLHAGLVPVGRSTTPEFGMTFDTTTNYLGTLKVTRNPWSLAHTPGGSSGGSAAAVAAGITPISMSSDGGGSTRIPAAFCGLVGLKATRGRVPRPLSQSEYMVRISTDGVVTRSVRDSAAALDSMARMPNGGSFIAMGPHEGSYLDTLARDPAPLRIGLSTGNWGRASTTDPVVADRVRTVARLLETLGHHVEEIDDTTICGWDALWWGYVTGWIASRAQFATTARDKGLAAADLPKMLGPMVYRHFVAAERYDKFDLWKMMACNNNVTRAFGRLMERYDILLTPSLAIRTPEANGPYSLLQDEALEPWIERLADACRYTMPGNETGLPGISIPAGLAPDGLPIGVQFQGNFRSEDLLLQLAAQVERARPEWFGAVPPVHVSRGD